MRGILLYLYVYYYREYSVFLTEIELQFNHPSSLRYTYTICFHLSSHVIKNV